VPADGPVPDGYGAFLDAATAARRSLVEAHPGLDAIERADLEAFLSQSIETALQLVAVDAARPAFVPWQTPTRRYADNGPDSVYRMAWVEPGRRYRVDGRRRDECYLSLSLYALDSGQPDRQVFSVNHRDLGADVDGAFELELAPADGASMLLSRQYFLDPQRDRPGELAIAPLDAADRDAPPGDGAGWVRAARCLTALTTPARAATTRPPWVSDVPNVVGDPSGWESDPVPGRGAVDQAYASGPFDLEPGTALVMETVLPPAAYASATAWNRFGQSVDARFHRSVLNARAVVPEPDGSVRVVVAAADPGVPNWLDTGGRRRGQIFWRFLLPEGPLHPIRCRVVPFADL
jgi:hypothetical protein